jgi:hypothetical protein
MESAADSRVILPLNRDQTAFDCLLTVNVTNTYLFVLIHVIYEYFYPQGCDYVINLIAPHYPSLRQCSYSVTWNLKSILDNSTKVNDYELKNIETFLDEITAVIVSVIISNSNIRLGINEHLCFSERIPWH